MAVSFLVDVCVGTYVSDVIPTLCSEHNFLNVRAINPKMQDMAIIDLAWQEKRIIITYDKDFGELVFNSKKSNKGVLLLRIGNHTFDEQIDVICTIVNEFALQLKDSFSVYQNGKLRIRSL